MPRIALAILFVLVTAPVFGQTPSLQQSEPLRPGDAVNTGMSPERLARIDAMVEEAIELGQIPGAVALVARDGEIVYHKAFGSADASGNRQLKKDDIFRIASQTKAITSTAVMMLWEQALFRLDDPISNYIPEFEDPQILDTFNEEDSTYTTVPADDPITIRHLITHTSGIGYGIIDGDDRMRKIYQKAGIVDLFTLKDVPIGENIRKLARLPLHHNPGEKFTYSEGLDVLGYFVEVVSGQPFDEYLQEHIFDPLGMTDTRFYLPDSKADRLVQVQTKNEEGEWTHFTGLQYYDASYPVAGAQTFFSGGAGLSSTATDYAKFLQMYLNGGEYNGTRLLSRTTVDFIMSNQTGGVWGSATKDYGLAFGLITEEGFRRGGLGSPGTFDWGGYFNTSYFAEPEEQLIGIIMKQTFGGSGDQTSWKFRVLARQAIDD